MRLEARPTRPGFLPLLLAAGLLVVPAIAAATGAAAAGIPAATGPDAGPPADSPTRSLRGIEVTSGPDGGHRIVLQLDGAAEFRQHEVEDPYRVVVDLENTVSRLGHNVHPVGSGQVHRVRAGQYRAEPSPVARIVLDMNGRHPVTTSREGRNLVLEVSPASPKGPAPEIARAAAPAPPVAPAEPSAAPAVPRTPPAEPAPAPVTPPPAPAAPSAPWTPPAEPAPAAARPQPAAPPAPAPTAIPPAAPSAPPAPPQAEEPAAAVQTGRLVVGSLPGGPAVRELAPGEEPEAARPHRTAASIPAVTSEPPSKRFAAAEPPAGSSAFERRTIAGEEVRYTGKRISLNLVDADVKQVFRLFHEISGLNFVLDPAVAGRVTIVVDEVPWDQALDLILLNNGLDKVYENNVVRIATTQKLAQEASARKALKEAKELEADTVTITRTLSYAKARDVDQVIKTGVLLSARGKSFFDERTNTIIITDVPTKIDPIDRLLTSLDEKTMQVVIEARIVETSLEYVQDLGIRWGFSGERSPAKGNALDWKFPHRASVDWDLNLSRNPGVSQLGFSFGNISDSFTLDLALDALESEGRARILSAPKVQTQNNVAAEIEQGIRLPIVNTTATEINVEFVSASLRLKVTPQITREGTVSLDLDVENNSPDFVNRTGEQPSIRTQRATTRVLVTDGGTTVIGGIFTINEGTSQVGVPFFSKIPLFGWLFKSRNITNENRELLVFVTPKIIKD